MARESTDSDAGDWLRGPLLAAFAEDGSRDGLLPVDAYVARYPDHADAVRRIYAEYVGDATLAAVANVTETPLGRMGRFELLNEIGSGGQGVVYRARDTRLGRDVALKLLRSGPGSGLAQGAEARLLREARIAASLHDPGICPILDVGLIDGTTFISMEFIRGRSLASWIHEREPATALASDQETTTALPFVSDEPAPRAPLPDRGDVERILIWFESLARSLATAHAAGVIHRDLKPGNIMIREAGRPVLLDFGLATGSDPDQPTITHTGDILGTPAYMSPEQIVDGPAVVTPASDIFSLGVALHETLCLTRPFEAPTRSGLFEAIRRQPAPDLCQLNSNCPRDLATIVHACLEKHPSRRYLSAEALAVDLANIRARRPISIRAPGPIELTIRLIQRHPSRAAIASLVLLVVASVAVGLRFRAQSIERKRQADVQMAYRTLLTDPRLDTLALMDPEFRPRAERWLTAHDLTRREHAAKVDALEPEPVKGVQQHALSAGAREVVVSRIAVRTYVETIARLPSVRRRWQALAAEMSSENAGVDMGVAWTEEVSESFAPMLGLVPLSRSASSGRWEFWHCPSGIAPSDAGLEKEILDVTPPTWFDGEGMTFVLVPGGSFVMGNEGSDLPYRDENSRDFARPGEDLNDIERPAHQVSLAPFLISKYEVTRAQWDTLLPQFFSWGENAVFEYPTSTPPSPNWPRGGLSWILANRAVSHWGLDLPTEAQWEYAATAGKSNPWWRSLRELAQGEKASPSATLPFAANFKVEEDAKEEQLRDVGHVDYPPNAFGLHETSGSVYEWCQDWYTSYPSEAARSGLDPITGLMGKRMDPHGERTLRGGSFLQFWEHSIPIRRRRARPEVNDEDFGFRPVRNLMP